MPFSKIAHAAALEKVAAADAHEQRDAIDAGFEHACDTLELNDLQRANLAKFAAVVLDVAKPTSGLAKVAADIVGNAAPAGDPNAELFKQRLIAEQAKAKALAQGQARAANPGVPPAKPVGAGGDELFNMMGGMTGPDISPPKPVTPPAPKPVAAPAPPVKPVVAPKPAVPPSPAPPVIPGAK
ncbi:MAG TPA: hypothetical protein PLS53_10920 [Thermoanaerobaculaceae bacterium]|nr:hypothetical protein [Thermoanaerobaculaceae bacterium]